MTIFNLIVFSALWWHTNVYLDKNNHSDEKEWPKHESFMSEDQNVVQSALVNSHNMII